MCMYFRVPCHPRLQYHNVGYRNAALLFHSNQMPWKSLGTRSEHQSANLKPNLQERKRNDWSTKQAKSGKTVIESMRALLRQATYLPDSAAREFFHDHIIASFRRYCPRKFRSSDKPYQITRERRKQRLDNARKAWKVLVRANHGSQQHLRRVLEMAYGRRGKKKYDLMKDVLPPETSQDSKALEELSLIIEERHSRVKGKEPRLSEKLYALIRSQKQQKDRLFPKKNIKCTEPTIPEQNIWLRPMPKNRSKNIRKKWYAETMDRVMPPLPEADWNRLKDLSLGKLSWEGLRQPRKRAQGHFITDSWEPERNSDWHELTPRFMRHMWESVFVQCPMMRWNTDRQRWSVLWGRPHTATAVSIDADFYIDDGAFQGVNTKGKFEGAGESTE